MSQIDIKSLFPTPLMTVTEAVPAELVQTCIEHIQATDTKENFKSTLLRHNEIQDPANQAPYPAINECVVPHLEQFGFLLFGELLDWSVKEIWTNVLEAGGFQAPHTHANSFISAVVYLTETHFSARTVFHRGLGGREFIFNNDNADAQIGPFNGSKWIGPEAKPGDLILFPSYLLHEVPVNEGVQRMTIAFNAIPNRLDNFGYAVNFTGQRSNTAD